ncbi:hypothetical protein BH09MYX1_BH09MYX1_17370 [soil metagenome]
MAVTLEGVGKTYGGVRALVNVTASFSAGVVNIVEGPNGSGKTTLLAIVGTLVRPTVGRVSHGDLGATQVEVRQTLGWAGHDSLCYPDLSGRENVELAAELHGVDPGAAFARAAERFKLGAFVERAFRTYSRGQRQRVSLARALVHEPKLVLLDEPSTGLDKDGMHLLRGVVEAEASRGAIVIVITHDVGFIEGLAGKRLKMDRGRLVDDGSVSDETTQ